MKQPPKSANDKLVMEDYFAQMFATSDDETDTDKSIEAKLVEPQQQESSDTALVNRSKDGLTRIIKGGIDDEHTQRTRLVPERADCPMAIPTAIESATWWAIPDDDCESSADGAVDDDGVGAAPLQVVHLAVLSSLPLPSFHSWCWDWTWFVDAPS